MKEGEGSTTPPARRASKAERDRVKRWLWKWKTHFYLHMVEIQALFQDYPHDDDGEDGADVSAEIHAEIADTYHVVTVEIYPRFFTEHDAEEQERAIVHELAHVITQILSRLISRQRHGGIVTEREQWEADERATDWIARVVFYGGNSPGHERPLKRKRLVRAQAKKK